MQGHELQTESVMQVAYWLDTASLAVQHITCSSDVETLEHLSFTRCGSLILALWHNFLEDNSRFEVFECSGQRTAQFREPGFQRELAHAAGSRLAVAHSQDFSVWDLRSGQLIGARGPEPPAAQGPAGARVGLIAANKAGTRLAFSAQGSTAVYLYDAATLDAQGVIYPTGEGLLARLVSNQRQLCGLGWELGGCLLCWEGPSWTRGCNYVRLRDGGEYEETLGQDCGKTPLPAVSPDGVFVCLYFSSTATIGVHDTRSGQLLSTHAVDAPKLVQGELPDVAVSLSWSSCGCRLLLRITATAGMHVLEQIQVVQF